MLSPSEWVTNGIKPINFAPIEPPHEQVRWKQGWTKPGIAFGGPSDLPGEIGQAINARLGFDEG